jgi:methylmalonyl-CoA/ethylmalonyl-CoA epimerase
MIFDHIGLFVKDINYGRQQLQALLPIVSWTEVTEDPLMKVRVQFGIDSSNIRYELVAPFGEPNPVSGALASGANILNHVAYRCDDLTAAMKALYGQGALQIGEPQAAVAFGGRRVVFFLTPLNFIVELVENQSKRGGEGGSLK